VIPFSEELPEIQQKEGFVTFYGSTTLVLNAYADARFSSGIFYDKEVFSMENYFKQWGQHMLNYDSEVLTLPEIAQHKDRFGDYFIRPIYDDKAFSGTVMSMEDIRKLAASLTDSNNPYLDETTLVVISRPKVIVKEWRHFIVNKEIVSSSRYAIHGELSKSSQDVPEDLLAFVQARCEDYVPQDIFVMDTALHEDKFKIVECNCFNDTGFYAHDIGKIFRSVNAFLSQK